MIAAYRVITGMDVGILQDAGRTRHRHRPGRDLCLSHVRVDVE